MASTKSRIPPSLGPCNSQDHNLDWVLYPKSNYQYDSNENPSDELEQKQVSELICEIHSPIDLYSQQIEDSRHISYLNEHLEKYKNEGLRRSAVGVILCHEYDTPHILLLHDSSINTFSLPSIEYKSWEKPKTLLANKLLQYISIEPQTHTSTHQLTTLLPAEMVLDIGEFLGEWWRVEFYSAPLPYLPPHITRPKERIRLYQVTLPSRCIFNLPPNISLKPIPILELNSVTYGLALSGLVHTLSRFHMRYMIEVEATGPELDKTLSNQTSETQDSTLINADSQESAPFELLADISILPT